MARTSKLLTKEVVDFAKSALEKLGRSGAVAIKLRAIISANKHGITAIAKAFGTTKATMISWIKHVKDESLELLSVQEGRGRKFLLTNDQRDIVKQWVTEDSQITVDRLKQKILTEMNVKIGRSSVHRLMKDLKFSYITPRPRHYKQDPEAFAATKKKSDGKH